MKNMKLLFGRIFLASFILISCNNISNSPSNTSSADTSVAKTQIVISRLTEAKSVAKTIFEYLEQADLNQITKEQLDIKAKPLQSHLDSLRLVLTTNEIKELDAYRAQLLNDLVDRKVIRDRE
jgi:hypothetical protein